jgi:hypothetical protein
MVIEVKTTVQFQEAIDAVAKRIQDFRDGVTSKIKASAGLILGKKNEVGETFLLMGKLNKLNRPNPKDPEKVDGSYTVFSGSVELVDDEKEIPAVFVAAAREVKEETLRALKKKDVMDLIHRPSTQLVKNTGWKNFTAASFFVKISDEEGERIINIFKENLEREPQNEIIDLAWVSLKEIVEAQNKKADEYDTLRALLEEEWGQPFTSEELFADESLKEVYNRNIKLPSGISIAHFAARTILGIKEEK